MIIEEVKTMKKDILFVVDMQNDFVDGVLGTTEAQAIIDDVKNIVEEHRANDNLIIYTMDTHIEGEEPTKEEATLPVHCIKGTKGHEIISKLTPEDSDILLEKRYFVHEDLKQKIVDILVSKDIAYQDINKIILVGICTDICVVSNALALRSIFPFTQIEVVGDLCAGTTPEAHNAALSVMKSCLIDVL